MSDSAIMGISAQQGFAPVGPVFLCPCDSLDIFLRKVETHITTVSKNLTAGVYRACSGHVAPQESFASTVSSGHRNGMPPAGY